MSTTHARIRAAVLAVIAAALVAVTVAGHTHPATAHAAPAAPAPADAWTATDYGYLGALADAGLASGTDSHTLIDQGHLVCEGIAAAVPLPAMQARLAVLHPEWATGDQALSFIYAATAAYCPQTGAPAMDTDPSQA